MIYLTAIVLFLFGYFLNMFYITVLYHRALTHRAVILGPKMTKWLSMTGIWITGLDPKAWATMHRLHHLYSDTKDDPHSPIHKGVIGVWKAQYVEYRETIKKLKDQTDSRLNEVIKDIQFDLSFISKHDWSNLPYYIHAGISVALIFFLDSYLVGIAYFLGIMSHPVQGWMVNALAHKYGSRNHETGDHSKNNFWVALFVFGEGLQNNHHAHPERANFSERISEIDMGYWMCLVASWLGLIKLAKQRSK